jgi:hypothetical protein
MGEQSTRELLEFRQRHEQLKKQWDLLFDTLSEVASQPLEFTELQLPSLTLDQGGYRFSCAFTEATLFCEFQQFYTDGILRFGYQARAREGHLVDVVTDRIFFDVEGSVALTKDGLKDGSRISRTTALSIVMPRLLNALKSYMDKLV